MANSSYIITSDLTGPHASFGAQVGGLVQTFAPVTYLRTKALHDDGEILEVSRLARRPKKANANIAILDSGAILFESLRGAGRHLDERKKAAQEPTPETKTDEEVSNEEAQDFSGPIDHVNRFIDRMEFGPARKGEKTARIIILLTLGLNPKDVVTVMASAWYPGFSSRGTVLQRRRGLRIKGWEADFCTKHGISIPDDI